MEEKEFYNVMINEIDERVNKLQEDRKDYEKCIFVSNEMLKIQKFIPIITMIIGLIDTCLTKNYNFLYTLLYGGVCGFVGSLPVILITTTYFYFMKKHYNKKIIDIDKSISNSLNAKNMIMQELEKTNEKNIEDTIIKDRVSCILKENEIENNKEKKLVLRKKK